MYMQRQPLDVLFLGRFNLAMGCCLLDIYSSSVLFHMIISLIKTCSFSGNPNCPVATFELYLSKLHPNCEALWHSVDNDGFWYANAPVGKNTLGSMMTTISKWGKLSKIYSNHSIRATSITIMDECGIASRHIMKVSGHKSETSLKSYTQNISVIKKKEISATLSRSLGQDVIESEVQNGKCTVESSSETVTNKIVLINNDSLYDDLADLLTQPFEIESLSDSQFEKTVKDLQSSPVEIHRSPLSNFTNTSSVESAQFRRMPVMPTSDKMMNFIPHFAENFVVNINFNYK